MLSVVRFKKLIEILKILYRLINTQNYWVFGLFPSSDILENRKPNVSETESVYVLR
jgi:hypothetical protein